jgi:RNA polymerase sigma factor
MIYKKIVGSLQPGTKTPPAPQLTEERVMRIQQGDAELHNRFLEEYKPFVARTASRFAKRYVDPATSDEFSVALTAFNEAIMSFSPDGGSSFLRFAATVINRRLTDYARKEQRHRKQIPMSAFESEQEDEHPSNPVEAMQALERFAEEREGEARRAEILELSSALSAFGIRFSELAESSPRHEDSRELLKSVGKTLAEYEELFLLMMEKKMLPIKELLRHVRLSRKTLERNRKYIIAIAIIHSGAYPYLQEYLQPKNNRKDAGTVGGKQRA